MILSVPEAKSRFNVADDGAGIETILTLNPGQPALIYNSQGWLGFISAPTPHTQEQVRHLLDTLIQTSFDKAIIEAIDTSNKTVDIRVPTGRLMLVSYNTIDGISGNPRLPYKIVGVKHIISD